MPLNRITVARYNGQEAKNISMTPVVDYFLINSAMINKRQKQKDCRILLSSKTQLHEPLKFFRHYAIEIFCAKHCTANIMTSLHKQCTFTAVAGTVAVTITHLPSNVLY